MHVGKREKHEFFILDTWYCLMEEQVEGCGDAEVSKGHPGGVSGLEIRCPGLEVRLGVGEMQGGLLGNMSN